LCELGSISLYHVTTPMQDKAVRILGDVMEI